MFAAPPGVGTICSFLVHPEITTTQRRPRARPAESEFGMGILNIMYSLNLQGERYSHGTSGAAAENDGTTPLLPRACNFPQRVPGYGVNIWVDFVRLKTEKSFLRI